MDIQRANVDNNLIFYTFLIDFTWVSGYPTCQCGISRQPNTTGAWTRERVIHFSLQLRCMQPLAVEPLKGCLNLTKV